MNPEVIQAPTSTIASRHIKTMSIEEIPTPNAMHTPHSSASSSSRPTTPSNPIRRSDQIPLQTHINNSKLDDRQTREDGDEAQKNHNDASESFDAATPVPQVPDDLAIPFNSGRLASRKSYASLTATATSTPRATKTSTDSSSNSIKHLIQLYNSHSDSPESKKELKKRRDEEVGSKEVTSTRTTFFEAVSRHSSHVASTFDSRAPNTIAIREVLTSGTDQDSTGTDKTDLNRMKNAHHRSTPNLLISDQRESMISIESFDTAQTSWSEGTLTDGSMGKHKGVLKSPTSTPASTTEFQSTSELGAGETTSDEDDEESRAAWSTIQGLDSLGLGDPKPVADDPVLQPPDTPSGCNDMGVPLDLFRQSGVGDSPNPPAEGDELDEKCSMTSSSTVTGSCLDNSVALSEPPAPGRSSASASAASAPTGGEDRVRPKLTLLTNQTSPPVKIKIHPSASPPPREHGYLTSTRSPPNSEYSAQSCENPCENGENSGRNPHPPTSPSPSPPPPPPSLALPPPPYIMESSDPTESNSTPSSSTAAHQLSSIPPTNNSPNPSHPHSHQLPSSPRTNSSPRQPCAKCGQSMTGQFVRALGTVYHLNCFRCQDCGKVVASKFFPVDGNNSPDCKTQYPLCETDYFRRLGLICAKCGGALRGSYITALDMKFHVEHFTCSVCPTVFGPQDSYYEHSGQVYCHFHYSTRFAVKCTGCRTAILKQFVEINRNNTDEHWHPECYMINKFWNIKLAVSSPNSQKSFQPPENDPSHAHDINSDTNLTDPSSSTAVSIQTAITPQQSSGLPPGSPDDWRQQEAYETAQSLKDKQKQMEEQVYRIWTVLSTFEESSAACISEMLRHVSSGHYLEGVRMAGKFVLHVETLFAAIDDLDVLFRNKNAPEIAHVREARMLCKKIVNFFSLLSHTHETGARKMNITKELLSLVTGLAHYLKILIRIALTSALKLERQYIDRNGILQFLSRLDRLARDPDASKATSSQPSSQPERTAGPSNQQQPPSASTSNGKIRAYGYKSLTRALGTMVGKGEATTDLCEACKQTIEEECVRFGTGARWHMACLKCSNCHRTPIKYDKSGNPPNDSPNLNQPAQSNVKRFRLDVQPLRDGTRVKNLYIFCEECSQMAPRSPNSPPMNLKEGFESVTRLEQYAFLLCVALNKLYGLLKQRGILPASADDPRQVQMNGDERSLYDAYRNSSDIKRMKSVDLDRKLSTTARIPQRSTVVESPSGRVAQASTDPQYQNGTAPTSLRPNNDPLLRQVNSRSPVGPTRQVQDRPRANIPHHPRERELANLPRSEPPPRPPPTHLNLITQGQNHHPSATVSSLPTHGDFNKQPHPDFRPSLARNLTAVKIVDDQPPANELMVRDEPRLGSSSSPVGRDTAGITLADLPRAMEAEQFREQQKLLPTQVATLSELSALESVIVKHFAALTLASESSAIKEETSLDELLEIIEVRKGNFWGKLFKGGNDKAKIKKKGVFGVPLDVLIDRHGVDSLLGAGAGQLRVPSFVDDCISAMKQMDMSVEGVFRKNGNIRRLKELTDAIDRDDSNVNFSDDNAVQLAALLKKFLRDLPDPLLTFKLYHLFIASQRVTNDTARRKTLHLICCLLPKAHRDTMEVLFVFLKWVASFSHVDEETGSKMDLQNLATVITPNILYARSKDPTRDESFLAIRAVHELLEYQDEFFQMPPEVLVIMQDQELLNSNLNEITSKDILKRVEALLKVSNGKQLRPLGKAGAEHYRGKGEVLPHRPDLHASSIHYQDADKAEQHQQQSLAQARTGVGLFTHIAPPTSNQAINPNANGYPAPLTPGASTPVNQQEFVFYPPPSNNSNHLHQSPSHQRTSFHRDQVNSSSNTPHLPPSKLPSPHTPNPNFLALPNPHSNNHHPSNPQTDAGSLSSPSFVGNENNSSSSNNNNDSVINRIPVDQRSGG